MNKTLQSLLAAAGFAFLMSGFAQSGFAQAREESKPATGSTRPPATAPATGGKSSSMTSSPSDKAGAKASDKSADKAAGKSADKAAAGEPLDLNTASESELATLPKIGEARAKAIVNGRPYKRKDELVNKKILSQSVYDEIKDKVVAKQKAGSDKSAATEKKK